MRKAYAIIALLLTIAVIVGSFLPAKTASSAVLVSDKLLHTTAYFFITFFWLQSIISLSQNKKIKVSVAIFLLGITIEILQEILTKSRHSEALDVVANSIGIVVAYFMVTLFFQKNAIVNKNNL